MKQYKGYYIDHIQFNSTAEIDNFIKEKAVERFKTLNKLFARHGTMEANVLCSEQADYLHDTFGFSYEDLEEMEIAAYVEENGTGR